MSQWLTLEEQKHEAIWGKAWRGGKELSFKRKVSGFISASRRCVICGKLLGYPARYVIDGEAHYKCP